MKIQYQKLKLKSLLIGSLFQILREKYNRALKNYSVTSKIEAKKLVTRANLNKLSTQRSHKLHCVKCVCIWSFSGRLIHAFRVKNFGTEKLRIQTLFTQCCLY